VVFTTAMGAITMELADDKAPISCANFLRYVDAKLFDDQVFFRAMKLGDRPPIGLIEGGADPNKRFPPIAHESTKQTGLTHKNGAVSMARFAPGTADGDFFICMGDLSPLDAQPTQAGDNQGFAVFAMVVDGMDTARAILTSPVSATKGDGPMKGQMLEPPVKITTARRV
jgi:peptidyl-prolyl cis-trans isomerase A (cyclophilin A)